MKAAALSLLERGLGWRLLSARLLLRLFFGSLCACRRCRCRCTRRSILGWSIFLLAKEVVSDNIVDNFFQQLADKHAHRGLAEPGASIAVLASMASLLSTVSIPTWTASATLWLSLLWVSACCVPQCLLSEAPGDVAPLASGSQGRSRLPWPRAAG